MRGGTGCTRKGGSLERGVGINDPAVERRLVLRPDFVALRSADNGAGPWAAIQSVAKAQWEMIMKNGREL